MFEAVSGPVSRAKADQLVARLEHHNPTPVAVFLDEENGSGGGWSVGGHFLQEPDAIQLDLIAASLSCRPFRVSVVENRDWVALSLQGLRPVLSGGFLVHGSHDDSPMEDGTISIEIDASLAFGTGHHGTTQGCLEAIRRLHEQGIRPKAVCDIGCGTGVLAIAAAKLFGCHVIACDNDPQAVEVAGGNFCKNDVQELAQAVCCSGFAAREFQSEAGFDLALANILSGPLIEMAPDFCRHVVDGGRVVLSGLLATEKDEVEGAYLRSGFVLEHRIEKDVWLTLVLVKPPAPV